MNDGNKFQTKKSLGQHFLNSRVVPDWMVETAEINQGETVLEIGPGTGVLTRALLEAGAKVVALEADKRALAVLHENFQNYLSSGQLTPHQTDVRQLDFSEFGLRDHEFKIVANIPYYLSGHLLRVCLAGSIQPRSLVFLVQKEVAKRAAASLERGDKESLLSLSVQAFGEPVYVREVSRGHFTPSPQVDSAILLVRNIDRANFSQIDEAHFFSLLHLGFGQKRKQLLGNLSATYDRTELLHHFSTIGIEEKARAEDVPLNKWLQLTKATLSTDSA